MTADLLARSRPAPRPAHVIPLNFSLSLNLSLSPPPPTSGHIIQGIKPVLPPYGCNLPWHRYISGSGSSLETNCAFQSCEILRFHCWLRPLSIPLSLRLFVSVSLCLSVSVSVSLSLSLSIYIYIYTYISLSLSLSLSRSLSLPLSHFGWDGPHTMTSRAGGDPSRHRPWRHQGLHPDARGPGGGGGGGGGRACVHPGPGTAARSAAVAPFERTRILAPSPAGVPKSPIKTAKCANNKLLAMGALNV